MPSLPHDWTSDGFDRQKSYAKCNCLVRMWLWKVRFGWNSNSSANDIVLVSWPLWCGYRINVLVFHCHYPEWMSNHWSNSSSLVTKEERNWHTFGKFCMESVVFVHSIIDAGVNHTFSLLIEFRGRVHFRSEFPSQVQRNHIRWNLISICTHKFLIQFIQTITQCLGNHHWIGSKRIRLNVLHFDSQFYFGGLVFNIGFAIKRFVTIRVTYLHMKRTYVVCINLNKWNEKFRRKKRTCCMSVCVCVFCQSNELVTMIWYSIFFLFFQMYSVFSSLIFHICIYIRTRARLTYSIDSIQFCVCVYFLFLYVCN